MPPHHGLTATDAPEDATLPVILEAAQRLSRSRLWALPWGSSPTTCSTASVRTRSRSRAARCTSGSSRSPRRGRSPTTRPRSCSGSSTSPSTERPAPLDYYGEAALDAVLRGYAARLDGATVLFPCAAMRCVTRLAELAGGRLVLLSADRGQSREERIACGEHVALTVHGSFSVDVNYHAIGEIVARRGGQTLRPAHPHHHLCPTAFLLGEHVSGYAETQLAYEEHIERAGPDDACRGRPARLGDPRLFGGLPHEARRMVSGNGSGWRRAILPRYPAPHVDIIPQQRHCCAPRRAAVSRR